MAISRVRNARESNRNGTAVTDAAGVWSAGVRISAKRARSRPARAVTPQLERLRLGAKAPPRNKTDANSASTISGTRWANWRTSAAAWGWSISGLRDRGLRLALAGAL